MEAHRELALKTRAFLFVITVLTALAAAQLGCNPSGAGTKETSSKQSRPAGLLQAIETRTRHSAGVDPLPLVVAVHGLGDRPESFKTLLADLPAPARIITPRAPIEWNMGYAWFRVRIRSRNWNALSAGITRAAKQVAVLIDHLRDKYPTRGTPILCGFSQGGMISYAVAVHHPETIGLAIPVSGYLPKPLWPAAKNAATKYAPIRALHGSADALVPLQPTREAVEHLARLGFDASLTAYPGTPHTVDAAMRRDLYRLIAAKIDESGSTLNGPARSRPAQKNEKK